MFGNIFKTISLTKAVNGIERTLDTVNRLIPIYKELEPVMNNTKKAINIIKDFGNNASNKITKNVQNNITPIKEKISNNTNFQNNNPTFFQ